MVASRADDATEANGELRVTRGVQSPSLLATRSLDQLQRSKARMPVLADDDVVIHRHSERAGDVDDRLGHLDIRLRGRKDRRTDDCALKAKFHSGGNCCAAQISCWQILLQKSKIDQP
jgi:hypothetical protein